MKLLFQLGACLVAASIGFAQGPQATGTGRLVGTISLVDAASRELTVKPDTGGAKRRVAVSPEASVLRIAPGEKDLARAQKITFLEIEAGDRVLIRGTPATDGSLHANSVVVVSKGDLALKQEAERAEWRNRGISGKVSAIDPARREITVAAMAHSAPASTTLRLAPNVIQKRYRPDSVRFTEALPSTLADIRIGDQLHALGENGSDGVFEAQQIVSGSFRTFIAVIAAADPAGRVLSVEETGGKEQIQVHIGQDCVLRRLTPEASRQLGMDGNRKPEETGGAKDRASGMQSILERMPSMLAEQLKSGDALIIAASVNPGKGPLFAFAILGGAEPLLAQSDSAQREFLGSWELNLDPTLP